MLCVIAKLSPDVNDRLSKLRETAVPRVHFASPLYAHITLATYLPEDTEAFITACGTIFRETHPFSVRYEKLEVLSETSILVAVPAPSEPLISLHNRIEKDFGEHLDRWTRGETWYPHTTLLCDPGADLNTLCDEMQKHFSPFDARIEQIEFSKVEENGYTIVKSVHLL